jgi:hypothetical protein
MNCFEAKIELCYGCEGSIIYTSEHYYCLLDHYIVKLNSGHDQKHFIREEIKEINNVYKDLGTEALYVILKHAIQSVCPEFLPYFNKIQLLI